MILRHSSERPRKVTRAAKMLPLMLSGILDLILQLIIHYNGYKVEKMDIPSQHDTRCFLCILNKHLVAKKQKSKVKCFQNFHPRILCTPCIVMLPTRIATLSETFVRFLDIMPHSMLLSDYFKSSQFSTSNHTLPINHLEQHFLVKWLNSINNNGMRNIYKL